MSCFIKGGKIKFQDLFLTAETSYWPNRKKHKNMIQFFGNFYLKNNLSLKQQKFKKEKNKKQKFSSLL